MSHHGLSLVELLVAVLILSTVLGGLFMGLHTGYQGTERLSEESYASNHAISLLEALSLVPYSKLPEVPPGTPEAEIPDLLSGATAFTFPGVPDPKYPRTVAVTEVSRRAKDPGDPRNSPWGALKRIRVEVSWEARYLRTHRTRRLVFQTLVTDDTEVSR